MPSLKTIKKDLCVKTEVIIHLKNTAQISRNKEKFMILFVSFLCMFMPDYLIATIHIIYHAKKKRESREFSHFHSTDLRKMESKNIFMRNLWTDNTPKRGNRPISHKTFSM